MYFNNYKKIFIILSFISFLFISNINIALALGETTTINTAKEAPTANTTYKLLAPIGSFSELKASDNIGDYFNIMIKIAIGLCAVLAVVMIVIGGIQYMGNESIFGKTEAKGQITKAIFGLIIALGSYALLNTVSPALLGGNGLNVKTVSGEIIQISTEDTSTGSSTTLCISKTNPPNANNASGTTLTLNSSMTNYINTRETLKASSGGNLSTGIKLLITAQAAFEGYYPGTKSYSTNNPGNIGNTDSGATKSYSTLREGILAQYNLTSRIANGESPSYKVGGSYPCALNEKYNGYLYQYLRIYATGPRNSNDYLNAIIGYFKSQGKTITAKTTMREIRDMK